MARSSLRLSSCKRGACSQACGLRQVSPFLAKGSAMEICSRGAPAVASARHRLRLSSGGRSVHKSQRKWLMSQSKCLDQTLFDAVQVLRTNVLILNLKTHMSQGLSYPTTFTKRPPPRKALPTSPAMIYSDRGMCVSGGSTPPTWRIAICAARSAHGGKRWLWVKNRYPKWNPGKRKHGLKPAFAWWFNFDSQWPWAGEMLLALLLLARSHCTN